MIKVSLKQAIKNYVRGQLSSLGLLEDLGLEFNLPLLYSIDPAKGEPVPTFSRSTTATVIDFEGVVQTANINEIRFHGARRVENLLSNTEALSTQTITVIPGISYILSFAGTGSITLSGAATGTLAGTGSDRVEVTKSATTTSLTLTVSGSVLQAQLEKVSGTQTEASEYVSSGVLSFPYHGANVDGVKYFDTDRSGNKLIGLEGALIEPTRTNLVSYSADFSYASWSKAGVTATGNRIVESATPGVHTIVPMVSGFISGKYYKGSIKVKKGSGATAPNIIQLTFGTVAFGTNQYANFNIFTGEILTNTGGVATITALYDGEFLLTWTAKCITTSDSTAIALAFTNNMDSVRLPSYPGSVTSDIYMNNAQVELGSFATSYIPTEGASVTRTADILIINDSISNVLPNNFCFTGTWTPLGNGADYATTDIRLFGTQDSRGNAYEVTTIGGASYAYTPGTGGGVFTIDTDDIVAATEQKFAFQLRQKGANVEAKIYLNGAEKLNSTVEQTLDHSNTSLEITSWEGAVFGCNLKNIKIYHKELSDSQLARITS